MKRLNINLSAHYFSGVYPIMQVDFLARFSKEAVIKEMAEAQAFLGFP